MKLYKDLFIALIPIIGLVVIGFVVYFLFKAPSNSDKSEYGETLILMSFWMLSTSVVLAFLALKGSKKSKKNKINFFY